MECLKVTKTGVQNIGSQMQDDQAGIDENNHFVYVQRLSLMWINPFWMQNQNKCLYENMVSFIFSTTIAVEWVFKY